MSRRFAEPAHGRLRCFAHAGAPRAYLGRARRRPQWRAQHEPQGEAMKVLLWIVLIIFLIGLAVVLGIGGLIF